MPSPSPFGNQRQNMTGWEGDTKVWRVEDGVILGGSMDGNPQNEFLSSKNSYRNFHLKLDAKLTGTEGFINGEVQFRSKRLTQPPTKCSGIRPTSEPDTPAACMMNRAGKKSSVAADKTLIASIEKPGELEHLQNSV